MIVTLLERYLEKRREVTRTDSLTGNVQRLAKLPPVPSGTFASLSRNPRQIDATIPAAHAAWSLEVLSLPGVESFERVHARATDILEKIQQANDERIIDQQIASNARTKVEAAYQFLQWPQNRKRVAELLMKHPQLNPSRALTSHAGSGSLLDTFAYLLHRNLTGKPTSE